MTITNKEGFDMTCDPHNRQIDENIEVRNALNELIEAMKKFTTIVDALPHVKAEEEE